jgi:hypothetical protein
MKPGPEQQLRPAGQHWWTKPVRSGQQVPLQQVVPPMVCTQQLLPAGQQVGPVEAAQREVVAMHAPLQQTLPEAQQVPGVPQQLAPAAQQVPLQQT